jgi:hypothetical protein
LFDTVRGANKVIRSSQASSDTTCTQQLMSFDNNGYTVGTNSDGGNYVNLSGEDYVAWCWKAGGNEGTFNKDGVGYASAAAVGLTAGTITPIGASIGTKQGFSIIKTTGNGTNSAQSIPHGLSQTPDFIIHSSLDYAYDFGIGHRSVSDKVGWFTDDDWDSGWASYGAGSWDPSSNTSTTFGTAPGTSTSDYPNTSGHEYIHYVWHNVPGLQKFGTYTGNNDPDGPYVELGFSPAFIMVKRIDAAHNYYIFDNKRTTSNPQGWNLMANDNAAEDGPSNIPLDFLSNGFKIRGDGNAHNGGQSGGGGTYIYMAWAHQPMNNLYGAQSNAR